MHRFVTCPHCDQAFRIEYLVRRHPVNVVTAVPCLHCREPIPNPGPPSECPEGFVACRLMAADEPAPRPGRFGAVGNGLIGGLRWIAQTRGVEWLRCLLKTRRMGWLLCLIPLALLEFCDILSIEHPADWALFCGLIAVPLVAVVVWSELSP